MNGQPGRQGGEKHHGSLLASEPMLGESRALVDSKARPGELDLCNGGL